MRRPTGLFVLTAALLFGIPTVTPAQFLLHDLTTNPSRDCLMVKSVDYDGDGDLDLVVCETGRVLLMENDGCQRFTASVLATGSEYIGAYPADLDSDGDVDILITRDGFNSLQWLEQQSGHLFEPHVIRADAEGYNDIVVADMDGDDDMDIVTTSPEGVQWYENDGSEEFDYAYIEQGNVGYSYLDIVDIDEDSDLDILFAQHNNNFCIYLNDGAMNFTYMDLGYNYNERKAGIRAADMDNDGDLDIVGGTYSCHVVVFTQVEQDSFIFDEIEQDYDLMTDIDVVDFDNDGLKDIVATKYDGHFDFDNIAIWYNGGDEGYEYQVIEDDINVILDTEPVDLDGDGDKDLLFAGCANVNLGWYENLTGEECVLIAEPESGSNWYDQAGGTLSWDLTAINLTDEALTADIWLTLHRPDGGNDDPVLLYEGYELSSGDTLTNSMSLDIPADEEPGSYRAEVRIGEEPDQVWDADGFTWIVGPNAPTPFTILQPGEGLYHRSLFDSLYWEPSYDIDPDNTPTYSIRIGNEPDLSDGVWVANVSGQFSWPIPTLERGQAWYWTVRANDENTDGTWASDTLCFTSDFPDRPEPFELISPEDDHEIGSTRDFSLTFSWHSTTDPDLFDSVWYELQLTMDPSFENEPVQVFETGSDTTFALDSLAQDTWFWRVVAYDRLDYRRATEERQLLVTLDVNESEAAALPLKFAITSTYPNPFNPSLNVEVALPQTGELTVTVFNVLGEEVATLATNRFEAGYHVLTWDATRQASGVYFVRASTPNRAVAMQKVVLIK